MRATIYPRYCLSSINTRNRQTLSYLMQHQTDPHSFKHRTPILSHYQRSKPTPARQDKSCSAMTAFSREVLLIPIRTHFGFSSLPRPSRVGVFKFPLRTRSVARPFRLPCRMSVKPETARSLELGRDMEVRQGDISVKQHM